MADQYDNTNRGSLFKNDRKELDTHPDYNGSINIEGRDYWLNGWIKESKKDGKKFFSLSVKPKDQDAGKNVVKAKPAPARAKSADGDEIPF
jgi:hypothetical protein